MKSIAEQLQAQINLHRAQGIDVQVSHVRPTGNEDGGYSCDGETTISVADSDEYDVFEEAEKYRAIVGRCDSGFGFGYRDMQLCAYFPNLV